MGIKGSIFVASMLAVSVAGCGSSKHSSMSTSNGQATAGSDSSTTVVFAHVDAASNRGGVTFSDASLSSLRQLSDGACDIEVVGSRPATITGARMAVSTTGASTRVTSIHVSPRYVSSAEASNHALIGMGPYGDAAFAPPKQNRAGFRSVSGVQLPPGFYNVVVQGDISFGDNHTVKIPAVYVDLRSGTNRTTLTCTSVVALKFVK